MRIIKFYLLICSINIISITANAQKKVIANDLLEITGAALLNNQRASDYSISVYLDGTRIDSIYSKSKKNIKFYVAYEKVYTVLFQKANCIDKIVIVNTILPKGLKSMHDNTFDFEVEMSQVLSKNNKDLEDYPIAILYIDKDEEVLQASAEYNKFTHAKAEVITTEVPNPKSKKK